MSIWTHAAGIIRVDSFGQFKDITENLKNLFKTCDFDSPIKDWDDCNVQKGSEGSLQVVVWKNPDVECMASHTISIFGDLRDYGIEDKEKFITWWKAILKRCAHVPGGCGIRNAVINVMFEDGGSYILDDKGHQYKIGGKNETIFNYL